VQADRWQQIEKLFYSALECAPHERAAYLLQACAGDEELSGQTSAQRTHHQRGAAAPLRERSAHGIGAQPSEYHHHLRNRPGG
jgi:hypothetical protein